MTKSEKAAEPATERRLFLGIEAGPGRADTHGAANPWRKVTLSAILAGCAPVFILFLTVGPVLVTSLEEAGLSQAEITGWMMGIHVFGGLNGLVLSLYYKQPFVGAYSIPGIAIVAAALASVTYPQAIGGFIIAGLIVLVLGLTGVAKRIVRYIPGPIMAAMIGGILLSFPLQIIDGVRADATLGLAAVVGYIVFHLAVPRVPGIVGALVGGGGAAIVLNRFEFAPVDWAVASPHVQAPEFSLIAVVSISIPLAIAVLGSENMQAIGVMRSIGFRPPVTALTVLSGLGGVLCGIFGGHNANIAGPATAAVASPEVGPRESRYIVAFLAGFVVIAFGVFAPVVTQVFAFFPEPLLMVLVGLVLLPVVASAFADAWRESRFTLSVIVTFVIAVSGIAPFGVSAAFWALLAGCATALLVENTAFRAYLAASVPEPRSSDPDDTPATPATQEARPESATAAEPAGPTEPAKASGPAERTVQTEPTEPTVPTEPTASVDASPSASTTQSTRTSQS